MYCISLFFAFLAVPASAQIKGFNYGATFESGACRDEANFRSLFQQAQDLPGASGFAAARLYTTIQCGTSNAPTSAIQAAIDTGTNLLLGMWASAGSDSFNNELNALTQAIGTYPNLADRVIGISVGSEDLYRSSPQGVANSAGVGADAGALTGYIGRVRNAIQGTSLASKPIGHVDTWTAWVLPENAQVIRAVDWLGHNSFPYFENTKPNGIDQAADVFNSALGNTEFVAGGKPVWITETGWPHTGPASGQAIASQQNAQTYWKVVGCSLFGRRNVWWYTLEDANTAQTEIEFGITPVNGGSPIFDLSCANVAQSSSVALSSSIAPTSSIAPPPSTSLSTPTMSSPTVPQPASQEAASTMSVPSASATSSSQLISSTSSTSILLATSSSTADSSTADSSTPATSSSAAPTTSSTNSSLGSTSSIESSSNSISNSAPTLQPTGAANSRTLHGTHSIALLIFGVVAVLL